MTTPVNQLLGKSKYWNLKVFFLFVFSRFPILQYFTENTTATKTKIMFVFYQALKEVVSVGFFYKWHLE